MNKPDFEKVLTQDIKDSPTWFIQILDPLNRLFEYIKEAFNSNISVSNLKVQVIEYSFTTPFIPLSFEKTKKDRVIGVLLAQIIKQDGSPSFGNTGYDWHEESGRIFIDGIYSLGINESYKVIFLALY